MKNHCNKELKFPRLLGNCSGAANDSVLIFNSYCWSAVEQDPSVRSYASKLGVLVGYHVWTNNAFSLSILNLAQWNSVKSWMNNKECFLPRIVYSCISISELSWLSHYWKPLDGNNHTNCCHLKHYPVDASAGCKSFGGTFQTGCPQSPPPPYKSMCQNSRVLANTPPNVNSELDEGFRVYRKGYIGQ